MPKASSQLLTGTELEFMLVLWALREASVREVLEVISSRRQVAYTTASTIIRILERKGFVRSRKAGKGHLYLPVVSKEEYESRTLGHVVDTLFDRTPSALVARLVSDRTLSSEELGEIRKLLDAEDDSE